MLGRSPKNMKLIHPVYLDVPMLVSFAAAIEGGITLDSEITKSEGNTQTTGAAIKTKFGLSSLFQSFFNADVEAQLESNKEGVTTTITKEHKEHTEASLAILLYDAICKDKGFLRRPSTQEEINQLKDGELIELSGQVFKNAIDSVIDAIDATILLSSLDTSISKSQVNKGNEGMKRMREALHKDRSRTPLSNIILKSIEPIDLDAVVTLRTENLRDLTLSELHKNSVKVVGKVTRIISEGETMSPFENYGMSMLDSATLKEVFNGLAESEGTNIELSDIVIKGPAVQILPLMVYV